MLIYVQIVIGTHQKGQAILKSVRDFKYFVKIMYSNFCI
jgi:hypothetical protein